MRRPLLNLVVDITAAVVFVGMMCTGYILYWPLPPGTNKSHFLWGLSRHQWGAVHAWFSLALLITLVIHLALHWTWIVSIVRRELGLPATPPGRQLRATAVSLAFIAAVLVTFAWTAQWSVRERAVPLEPHDPIRSVTASPLESSASATWSEVHQILRESCLPCHGSGRVRGDFRVDRRDDYFGGGSGRPLVIPGDSRRSPLIAIVSGQRPDLALADRHRLSEREVGVLRRWIDAGAVWSPEGTPGQ
ncbi:DUF4405 domain-containing protein [Planctellipticum variicoloris]|uniref:DUF4405 domain-containing protein n=1 Tax=Planctellipticum variicoloris TaxID=3064265 RepID=UPI003013F702|nr:DUF4405 domain-containing protein [Planctomycetaceae bacterium SH412]